MSLSPVVELVDPAHLPCASYVVTCAPGFTLVRIFTAPNREFFKTVDKGWAALSGRNRLAETHWVRGGNGRLAA